MKLPTELDILFNADPKINLDNDELFLDFEN